MRKVPPVITTHAVVLTDRCTALAQRAFGPSASVELSRTRRTDGNPEWHARVWLGECQATECEAKAFGADRRHALVKLEAELHRVLYTRDLDLHHG